MAHRLQDGFRQTRWIGPVAEGQNIYYLHGVTSCALAAIPSVSAQGPFSVPGSALAIMRQKIDIVPGGLKKVTAVDVRDLHFAYNPSQGTLVTWKGGNRHATAVISRDADAVVREKGPITISGRVALAIVRGIGQRKTSIPRSFLTRERQGRFSIVGYDHGNSVFFVENFLSESYKSQIATPRVLDVCAPHIGYLVDVPSYRLRIVDVRRCGSD